MKSLFNKTMPKESWLGGRGFNDNVSIGRRDSLTIIMDLLDNIHQTTRLTRLLYKTNLSYAQLKKYLDMLIQMGLVQEVNEPCHGFLITEKGRAFLQIVASHQRKGKLSVAKMIDFSA